MVPDGEASSAVSLGLAVAEANGSRSLRRVVTPNRRLRLATIAPFDQNTLGRPSEEHPVVLDR